nr:MAG TPA: hypothetical protein [Bacteriophage sp.]
MRAFSRPLNLKRHKTDTAALHGRFFIKFIYIKS